MLEPIKLPKLAVDMKKGKITKWLKEVGESIEAGKPLVEVSTGKINVEMDAPASGKLREILVPVGSEASVGTPIATIEIVKGETGGQETAKSTDPTKPGEEKQHDLIIIGGGPGGYVAAIRAAQLGKKVALVEKDKLGGTCLNRGCIPSKAMIKSAKLYTDINDSTEYGIETSGLHADITKIMKRKNRIVNQLRSGVEQLMKDNKITVYTGAGSLAGKNQVTVALGNKNLDLTARDIIIASGSVPAKLPVSGGNLPDVLNSDTVLEIDHLPASIVVIGGGYIAIEMGCFFHALGSKVTIIEMQARILPFADRELSNDLHTMLTDDGISIHTKTKVNSITKVEGGGLAVLTTGDNDAEKLFYCEQVLNATGRVCNTEGLNLARVGIEMDGPGVKVNEKMETNIPHIYAIGDVIGKSMLAHVASKEGIIAVENTAGKNRKVDYSVVPSVVFSHPEIGHVGLTEEEAREQNLDFTVGRFPFMALGKALAEGETRGQCKLICCKKTGKILGAHIIGPKATDLVATVAVSMKNGITAEQLTTTIFAHPTTAEIIAETANMAMGTPIHLPGENSK